MSSLLKTWAASKHYARVSTTDVDNDGLSVDFDVLEEKHVRSRLPSQSRRRLAILAGAIVLVALGSALIVRANLWPSATSACRQAPVRKEWRTLSQSAQLEYIGAVSCLMRQPSIFNEGTYHYDDFVFTHTKAGSYSHYAAAFLAWHRLFVHNYENALRSKCAFSGQLPYWDWTLDSHNLSASPIWDPIFGFGGDGLKSDGTAVHDGRCVGDGPFADTTRAFSAAPGGHGEVSHEAKFEPHCLSRGFRNDSLLTTIQKLVSADTVEKTLAQPDYNSFFQAFEAGPHNAIPQFVDGDFITFTAPNDPVFWLHHTQVDRLWWLWQHRDPDTRLKQFHGPTEDFRQGGHGSSSLQDLLPMAGLSEDRRVEEVMDTEDGILCYRY